MSTPLPRKRFPVNPSIEHLKKQAKRRAKADASSLAQAQHQLAREYGCRNWAELVQVVETMSRGASLTQNVKNEFEPLPEAANRNELAAVRQMLDQGQFTQHDLDLALARAVLRFTERRAIAELLIEHGADPNGQYGANYGPIILAPCETLDAEGIRFLIEHGAEVDFEVQTKYGLVTPMIAVLNSYVRGRNADRRRCFEILASAGATVPRDIPPALLAVMLGDARRLSELVDAEPALVHRRLGNLPYGNIVLRGATLLHAAVDYGTVECIELLLRKGAQVNAIAQVIEGVGGQTPIFHAIASPLPDANIAAVEYLLNDAGQWLDLPIKGTFERFGEKQTTPIAVVEFAAQQAQGKETREMKLLRRMNRPRVENPHFAAAVDAIDAGDVERLRSILREHPELAMARAEESGSYAGPYFARPALLWFVAENPKRTGRLPANTAEIAEVIIDAGTTREDITATAELVASGDVPRDSGVDTALLELLVARGADPSRALSGAVQEGQTRAIATLLRLGAKPNVAAAAGLGDLVALEAQLRAGGIMEQVKLHGMYNAAVRGQADAIEVLVRLGGVDVNARIGLQATALHQAAWNNRAETVERLLVLGADPTIRDGRFNSTPAMWAAYAGHQELARRLERTEQERTGRVAPSPERG